MKALFTVVNKESFKMQANIVRENVTIFPIVLVFYALGIVS